MNEEIMEGTKQVEAQPEEQMKIDVDAQTAFALKLQEFDKEIAQAEEKVATIKKDKATYIYDQNVQQVVAAHKEKLFRQQIEEEAKKKMLQ
jgi:hypothetical protein